MVRWWYSRTSYWCFDQGVLRCSRVQEHQEVVQDILTVARSGSDNERIWGRTALCEEPAKSPLGRRSIFSGNKGGFVGCYELDPSVDVGKRQIHRDKYTNTQLACTVWRAGWRALWEGKVFPLTTTAPPCRSVILVPDAIPPNIASSPPDYSSLRACDSWLFFVSR